MQRKIDEQLQQLYFSQYADMVGFLTKQALSRELAEDLVQDTFHEVLNHLVDFYDHPDPERWIWKILKNKFRDYLRQRQRDISLFIPYDIGDMYQLHVQDDPVQNYETKLELSEVLKSLSNVLKPEDLYVLRQHVFDQASHSEIAEEMHSTVWATQKRLERIRKYLRKRFPERQFRQQKLLRFFNKTRLLVLSILNGIGMILPWIDEL